MTTEIEDLREENARLRRTAEEMAAIADIFRSVVCMSTIDERRSRVFREKIGLALRLHGINDESPAGMAIVDAMTHMGGIEREKLIRAFRAIDLSRGRTGVTPGCDCVICTGVTDSRKTLVAERASRASQAEEMEQTMIPLDYYGTKNLQQRDTDEDRARGQALEEALIRGLTALGHLQQVTVEVGGVPGDLADLVQKIKEAGLGSVSVFSLGPNGATHITDL